MNKDSALLITQLYQKFPTINGSYLLELINLSWMVKDIGEEPVGKQPEEESKATE